MGNMTLLIVLDGRALIRNPEGPIIRAIIHFENREDHDLKKLFTERIGVKERKAVFLRIISLVMVVITIVGLSACSASSVKKSDSSEEPAKEISTESKEGKRIYFASALFNEAEREYNLKIVSILESYGYEVFLPQRDGFLAPDLEGMTEEAKVKKIFEKDRDEVLKADIFFMVLDGRVPDEGACVELGIAYANDKRCYGIKSDARSLELDMDLNPMITGCFIKIFYNLDGAELEKALEVYLKENQL